MNHDTGEVINPNRSSSASSSALPLTDLTNVDEKGIFTLQSGKNATALDISTGSRDIYDCEDLPLSSISPGHSTKTPDFSPEGFNSCAVPAHIPNLQDIVTQDNPSHQPSNLSLKTQPLYRRHSFSSPTQFYNQNIRPPLHNYSVLINDPQDYRQYTKPLVYSSEIPSPGQNQYSYWSKQNIPRNVQLTPQQKNPPNLDLSAHSVNYQYSPEGHDENVILPIYNINSINKEHQLTSPCQEQRYPTTNNTVLETTSANHSTNVHGSNLQSNAFNRTQSHDTEGTSSKLNNFIYQVLMTDPAGEFYLKIYNYIKDPANRKKLIDEKKTDYFSLSKIAHIVIFFEIRRTQSYDINAERLEFFAKSAYELFGEPYLQERFYCRAAQNRNASGAFQQAYISVREKAIAIGEIKINKSKQAIKRKRSNSGETTLDEFHDLKTQVDIIDDEYKTKWANTSQIKRLEFYLKSDIKIIFEKFPTLLHPMGYTLIQEDFRKKYSLCPDLFQKNWPDLAKKIYKLARERNDTKIRSFYTATRLSKKTETNDIRESLNKIQEELENIHAPYGLSFGFPFVVIYGKDLLQITSSYIVVGYHRYQIQSCIDAVNICYQIIKTLYSSYSLINNHIWQFIEREVFENFNLKTNSNIYKIVEELKRM